MVVQDDDKLVIYDVGLAKLLHEDVLIQFIDMTKCIAMGTPDDIVAHLKRFHTYIGEIDWDALRVEVEAFAQKFRGAGHREARVRRADRRDVRDRPQAPASARSPT